MTEGPTGHPESFYIYNGTLLPIRVSKIYNTSTAKDIIALN